MLCLPVGYRPLAGGWFTGGYGFRVESRPKPEILIICTAHRLQVPLEVRKVWEGSIVQTWKQPT